MLVKRPSPEHPNIPVNEYICNRLALSLGLPCPLGDLWYDEDSGTVCWVSAQIGVDGASYPPPGPEDLLRIDPGLRAKMEVFDTLVDNIDRNEDNILADTDGHAWLIDHDQALFGDTMADRANGLLSRKNRPGHDPSGFWGELNSDAALLSEATRSIQTALTTAAVASPAYQLCADSLITAAERDAVIEFLTHRRDILASLQRTAPTAHLSAAPGTLFTDGGE